MSLEKICKECDGYDDKCPKYHVVGAYTAYCENKMSYLEKQPDLFYPKQMEFELMELRHFDALVVEGRSHSSK